MTDIIAAIDAATGCQQCGNPLGPSPSDDFCGEGCQRAWLANFNRQGDAARREPHPNTEDVLAALREFRRIMAS